VSNASQTIVDTAFLVASYRKMLELRLFELKAQEVYRTGTMPGFIHLYVGQEAVAVGVCSALRSDDLIYSTHRGHGHALAKGVPPRNLFAELMGRTTGCSGGRGGSMHIFSREHGLMGTNGIVGGTIPIAAGSALSAKVRGSGQVVVSFFGDGAVNSGSFHESLTMAAVWDLPVVFVCENNLYATEMAFSRATKNTSVSSRASAYGLPGVAVDGNNVAAVFEESTRAVDRARAGGGPTLLECETYRVLGHHEGDPGTGYRTREEVQQWKLRCPIATLRKQLLEEGIDEAAMKAIDSEIERVIADAVEFAKSSPEPAVSSLLDHVF
jgi:pyruvate dehydrogenase E1 component alpha subunit